MQATLLDKPAANGAAKPLSAVDSSPLILKNPLSPGDVLCMTAAVYSLHQRHPGKYLTAVDSSVPSLWDFNPDVIPLKRAYELKAREIHTHYPLIQHCNQRAVHVLQGYCDFLTQTLGVEVPLLTNRPHLYLDDEELTWMNQVEEVTKRPTKFWLLNAGRKEDFTTKFWGTQNFQEVVDRLRGRVLFVQVGAREHYHPVLRNVIDLTGKTDMRQLIRLAYHAQGALGGVTFLQHLCAAWQKPYVSILGGREPSQWNQYPLQSTLSTVGALSCCRTEACWRSRTVALNDGGEQDQSLCEQPVYGGEPIPRCMALIRAEEVAETVLRYVEGLAE
jgi:hypothetical protein